MIISSDEWHIHPNIPDEGVIHQAGVAKAHAAKRVIVIKAGG
jgi:hypothetical protein